MPSLEGRVYIVTGGTGHLGRAVCERLADDGAWVYSISRDRARFTFEDPAIRFLQADVTDAAQVEHAVASVLDAEGRIDGLLSNAPASARGIEPYLALANAVLPSMVSAARGAIVNVASLWGIVSPDPRMYLDLGNEPPLHLPCAKAGVIALTRYLAVLHASHGIRVNTVTPGLFPKKRGPERPDYMREMERRIPMGRIGQPAEIAGAVSFLFSDASSYMTGQNLIIDGGYSAL